MFVFLSKLLPPFVYPLGLVCLLLLLALWLDWRTANPSGAPGWHKLRRGLLVTAILILWLGGNRFVAASLARSLELRYLPPAEIPTADAIVLLGGGTEAPDAPRPMVGLNGAGDRVLYAAELYRQGKAPYILVSGGLLDWSTQENSPAGDMADLLLKMDVPQEALWLQPRSRNTHEDALYSAEILRQKGAHRILLVTSAWHMPRSYRLFQAEGLEVIPAPTDFQVTYAGWQGMFEPDPRVQLLGLLPSAGNLATTSNMLKEYIGLLVYDLRGWY